MAVYSGYPNFKSGSLGTQTTAVVFCCCALVQDEKAEENDGRHCRQPVAGMEHEAARQATAAGLHSG